MSTPADQVLHPLLSISQRLFQSEAFDTRESVLPDSGTPWLIVENELFVIGLVAGPSLHDLREAATEATQELLDRLGGVSAGAKRWDVYLVMLTTEPWQAIDPRERSELIYNMRGVRRLVGVEIDLDDAAVRDVISPFLPLVFSHETAIKPLGEALAAALQTFEIAPDLAGRLVAAFLDKGTLDHV